jgi:hypothetical protein
VKPLPLCELSLLHEVRRCHPRWVISYWLEPLQKESRSLAPSRVSYWAELYGESGGAVANDSFCSYHSLQKTVVILDLAIKDQSQFEV